MSYFNIITQSSQSTVVTEYKPQFQPNGKSQKFG